MKVLVMMAYDYEYSCPTGEGFVVPDDFDINDAVRRWREETFRPARWKNMYGEGVSQKCKPTIPLVEWLRKKYDTVEVVECDF